VHPGGRQRGQQALADARQPFSGALGREAQIRLDVLGENVAKILLLPVIEDILSACRKGWQLNRAGRVCRGLRQRRARKNAQHHCGDKDPS
jgi:hypothetical protein